MPRTGFNPSRSRVSDYRPKRVTLAVITHVPHLSGYFENRFEVLRLCLESQIVNTSLPYDLMVFDNGSCPEVVNYLNRLKDEDKIHYLLLSSRNIGKIGAVQIVFNAAPGEIVGYTDDDIFFLPGWLEDHLKVIDTFPNVGMVTGLYIRPRVNYATESVMAFAGQPGVEARRGLLIPRAWEEEYIENSNRTWESYQAEIAGLEDLLLCYEGVEAFASAHHFQFVASKKVILEALPGDWSGQLMGQMSELDARVDQMGYLRLSTRQQTVHLMGNLVPELVAGKARGFGLSVETKRRKPQPVGFLRKIYRFPLVRRLALVMYNRLYYVVNE